jgi:hypothetical protein
VSDSRSWVSLCSSRSLAAGGCGSTSSVRSSEDFVGTSFHDARPDSALTYCSPSFRSRYAAILYKRYPFREVISANLSLLLLKAQGFVSFPPLTPATVGLTPH